MTVDRIQCPVCYSELRIPPRNELGKLASVLREAPVTQAVMLKCKFCDSSFPIPGDSAEMELDDGFIPTPTGQDLKDLIERLKGDL